VHAPIVSLHMPKTAGTTFADMLARSVGSSNFNSDYDDKPLHAPLVACRLAALKAGLWGARLDAGSCVHGHFLAYKYRRTLLDGGAFVTWLRDPVERLRSHYDFWRDRHQPSFSEVTHQRMLDENWSFERFALGREMRNVYSRFLWRFPLTNFAFVGITEHFEEDLKAFTERFSRFSGIPSTPQNQRADHPPRIDRELVNRIERWHASDMALYNQAVKWRNEGRWRV